MIRGANKARQCHSTAPTADTSGTDVGRRWPWIVGIGTLALVQLAVCTAAVVVYESGPPPQQRTPATLVMTQWVKDPAIVDGPWPGYRPQISMMRPKMVARAVAHLDPAVPTPDLNGSDWLVEITLNAEGTRLFGALTKNAVAACSDDCPERHIAWWLDLSQDDIDHWNERASTDYRRIDQGGKLIFDPSVSAPITDGTVECR